MADAVAEAIGLPFTEAVNFFRGKARVPTRHWDEVWRTAHTRSFMVAGAANDALLSDFQKAIRKALEKGTTLAEFRQDFDAIVTRHGWDYNGTRNWRSRIIYETNLSMAYSAGRYAQLTKPATLEAFPYWRYVHSGSSCPRLQHLSWNGLTLRADDPFWTAHYPPNGWRCGCRVSPTSEAGLRRMGKSGPDTAPPAETREWRNPRTGEVHDVPVGIEPGFDYNPGQAWAEGGKGIPVKTPDLVPAGAAPEKAPPHVFPSLGAADTALTDATQAWADGLSETEAGALDDYKADMGRAMNAALRGGRPDPELDDGIEALAHALGRAKMPESVRVFRGVAGDAARGFQDASPGDVITDKAFTSATLLRSVAGAFAKDGVVIEINVPKGWQGAAYIHPFPRYRYRQYELLIQAGTALRVISNKNGHVILEPTDEDGN